jgi:hypothetical protein
LKNDLFDIAMKWKEDQNEANARPKLGGMYLDRRIMGNGRREHFGNNLSGVRKSLS